MGSWKSIKGALVSTNRVEAMDKPDRKRVSQIESGKSRKGAVVSMNTVEVTDKPDRKLERQKGS